MEEENESLHKLCRICFDRGNYELQTYELSIDSNKIALKSILKKFSTLEIQETDSIPSMLCTNCTDDLVKCYFFLKKLRKADEQLQQLLQDNLIKEQEEKIEKHSNDNLNKCTSIIIENVKDDNIKINQKNMHNCNEYISDSLLHIEQNEGDNNDEKYSNEDNYDDDDDDNDDNDVSNYIIEYINEENLNVLENKDVTKKGKKRKINNSKTPHIVVTDNVSNILSKVHKNSYSYTIGSSSSELKHFKNSRKNPQKQHSKNSSSTNIETINDKDSFVITRFVLTNDEIKNNSTTNNQYQNDNYNIDNNVNGNGSNNNINPSSSLSQTTSSSINQIRMFDMAPVEVKATFEMNINQNDDDTNVENLNTMYKCKYCPRAYSTSHYLIKHARKSHCCQFCMKGFGKTEDLHKHTKEEHNQFTCTLCKKDFSSNSNLRQHMKKIHNVNLPAHTSILSFKKSE